MGMCVCVFLFRNAFSRVWANCDVLLLLLFLIQCGEAVPVTKRGNLQAHSNEIKSLFHGFHVEIDARNENDLDPTTILKKVRASAGSKYTSHPSNQKAAFQDNEPPSKVGSVYEPVKTYPAPMSGGPKMMPGSVGGTAQQIREERQRREREQMEAERQRQVHMPSDDGDTKVGSSWKPVQTAPKPFTSRPGGFASKPQVAPKPSFGAKPSGFARKPPVASKPVGWQGVPQTPGSAVQSMYGAARQELTLGSAQNEEDPDASVGTNYVPVRTNPRPLGASNRSPVDEPEPLSGADAVRKAREAYDRELFEREKKKSYAQDRADDMDGISGADRIRKEREAYDAELKRREEERLRQSGQTIEDDSVIGNAQDVRREREEFDKQLQQREEERIKRWETSDGAGSRDPSLPAVPGRATVTGSTFNKLATPSSVGGSRGSSTVSSPTPSDVRRKSSTSGFGAQAHWTMPSKASLPKSPEPAPEPSAPPAMPPRPTTVEQAVVSQMSNVQISDDAPPPLPPHPQEEKAPVVQEPTPAPQNGHAADGDLATVVALYDYEKSKFAHASLDLLPIPLMLTVCLCRVAQLDEDNELSFREGEKIVNVQKLDSDWWFGSNVDGTAEGLFPANFGKLCSHADILPNHSGGDDVLTIP